MPSSKCNSIMAIVTDLISSLINIASSWNALFVNHSNSNPCIMVLPKFIFVLPCAPFLSPLLLWWQFVVCTLWLQCETWVSAVLAGALLILFFTWNVTLSICGSWKWSVMMHNDRVTHLTILIDNWGMCLNDRAIHIFRSGWIDCRDVFHAVLRL